VSLLSELTHSACVAACLFVVGRWQHVVWARHGAACWQDAVS